MKELTELIERCKDQKVGPCGDVPINWFVENLRRVLREMPGYTGNEECSDRSEDRKLIDGAETLGQLVDCLYFGWGLCEDPEGIARLMTKAVEDHGCVVAQDSPSEKGRGR